MGIQDLARGFLMSAPINIAFEAQSYTFKNSGPEEGRKASIIFPMQKDSQESPLATMFEKHEGCDKLARGNVFISWPPLTIGASTFPQFVNILDLHKVILTFSFNSEIFK